MVMKINPEEHRSPLTLPLSRKGRGNDNLAKEEDFLKKYCSEMPGTMLRYAVERFDEQKKGAYLKARRAARRHART